jgi:hypothetical protein
VGENGCTFEGMGVGKGRGGPCIPEAQRGGRTMGCLGTAWPPCTNLGHAASGDRPRQTVPTQLDGGHLGLRVPNPPFPTVLSLSASVTCTDVPLLTGVLCSWVALPGRSSPPEALEVSFRAEQIGGQLGWRPTWGGGSQLPPHHVFICKMGSQPGPLGVLLELVDWAWSVASPARWPQTSGTLLYLLEEGCSAFLCARHGHSSSTGTGVTAQR